MTTALEQASREYVQANGLTCPECESPNVYVQLPPPRRPWSPSKLEEELRRGLIVCRDCRAKDSPAAGTRPERIEDSPAVGLSVHRNEQAVGIQSDRVSPGAAAVAAYLAGMSRNSQRGMRDALTLLARMLGAAAPDEIAWHRLGYSDTSALQARLVAERNPDSAKKAICALRGVLKASKRLGLMTADAFERAVELERIRGSRIRNVKNLQKDDVAKLLASTRTDSKPMRAMRDRALIALLAGGGLRRAEAGSVTTTDFNRATRVVVVVGKGNKQRAVPLPEWAATSINEFVDARGFAGPILTPVSQRGEVERKALSGGQAVYVVARRIWRRAGLPPIGCHSFRRGFVTSLLRSGADPFLVSKIAGHSNPQITVASYDVRGVEDFTAAVDRLSNPEGAR